MVVYLKNYSPSHKKVISYKIINEKKPKLKYLYIISSWA